MQYKQEYVKDLFRIVPALILVGLFFNWLNTPETITIQAKSEVSVESPVASPEAPQLTETPEVVCETVTPYDSLIEKYFKDSCNAKRILKWTKNGNSYGENVKFITENADRQNRNGSWDRGLFRINSDTFADYLRRMPELLHNNQIYTWDDMLNIEKNIKMAQIIYIYEGYCAWFAVPNDLCARNYIDLK